MMEAVAGAAAVPGSPSKAEADAELTALDLRARREHPELPETCVCAVATPDKQPITVKTVRVIACMAYKNGHGALLVDCQ